MRILLLLLFVVSVSYAQSIDVRREIIKETLNEYYKDTDKQTFNAYTDTFNLNIDVEYDMDATRKDVVEILGMEKLEERTRDLIYSMASRIGKSVLMQQIKDASYANVVFKVTCITQDKNIVGQYDVNVDKLLVLSKNMNKGGFNAILNTEFLK